MFDVEVYVSEATVQQFTGYPMLHNSGLYKFSSLIFKICHGLLIIIFFSIVNRQKDEKKLYLTSVLEIYLIKTSKVSVFIENVNNIPKT